MQLSHKKTMSLATMVHAMVAFAPFYVHMASALCGLLGFATLVGLVFDIPLLAKPFPGNYGLHINAALGFISLSVAISLVMKGRRRLALLITLPNYIISLAPLIYYTHGMDVGLDRLLVSLITFKVPTSDYRMAFNTTLAFLFVNFGLHALMASSLLASRLSRTWRDYLAACCGVLGAVCAATALMTIAGYVTGFEAAYTWTHNNQMAIATAVCLSLSSSSLIVMAWYETQAHHRTFPPWLMLAAFAGFVVSTSIMWRAVASYESWLLRDWGQVMSDSMGKEPGEFDDELDLMLRNYRRLKVYNLSDDRRLRALPDFVLSAGILMSLLSVMGLYFARRARERAYEAEAVNSLLEQEVKQRRLAEEQSRKNEGRFIMAFENSPIGMAIVGLDGSFMEVNSTLCHMMGLTKADLLQVRLNEFTHPNDLGYYLMAIRRMLNGDIHTFQSEKRCRHAEGHFIWVILNLTLLRDEEGKPIHFFAQLQDITDIKNKETELLRANQALQESESSLASFFNSSPTMMGIMEMTKHDMVFVSANAATALFSRTTPTAMVGKSLRELGSNEEVVNRWVSWFRQVLDTGKPAVFDFEAIQNDQARWLSASLNFIGIAANGRPRFSYNTFDLTEHKATEVALIESSKTKSEFFANVSHEIRTPIHGVLGLADILVDSPLNAEQRDYVEGIRRSGDMLLAVVNDILDFSKIEAGKMELETIAFSLRGLVGDTQQHMMAIAAPKNLSISFSVDQDLPSTMMGDPVRLRQILNNLVSNAIKFTEEGEVSVTVRRQSHYDGRDLIRFEVRDTGIGIAPELQTQLFRPFSQADSTTTRRFGGTGLGLSISKYLAERMGGSIGFESEAGQGAHFWFTVCLAPVAAGEPPELRSGEPIALSFAGLSYRALVVEDVPMNQLIARKMLGKMGIDADIAVNGREALELLRGNQYNIILMDCQMPEMDGYEATRIIRADQSLRHRGTPIIAMTANAMKGDMERCLGVGMNDYLAKPISQERLASTIGKWLPPMTSAA